MKRKSVIVLLALLVLLMCACGSKETPTEEFAFEMVDGEIIITGYLGTDREIVIPDVINDRPVTVIAEEAFNEYDMLTITFPKYLREIETNAFAGCNCLVSVNFPECMERIEDGAFWSCDNLTEVKLPNSLEYLGEDAFGGCDKLATLEIPEDFDGFKIDVRCVSVEVTDSGRKEIYQEMIVSPVSDYTVLLIKPESEAQKLFELYIYIGNYVVLGSEEVSKEDAVVYLVEEKCTYNSENVMIQKIRYTYDEIGNMLSATVDDGEVTIIWNEEIMVYEYIVGKVDGKIDYANYWTYDMFSNMLTQERENADGTRELYYSFEYTYKNGLPAKQSIPNNSKDYTEYYYNDNGQLVRQLRYRLEYKEPLEFRFEYTSDGNLGKIYWDDGTEFAFSYNETSELTELTRTNEGTQIFRNKYECDSEGRIIIKEIYNSDNELQQRNEYFYDRDGLLTEEKITTVEHGETVYETVKYGYEKLRMSESVANLYYGRIQWRWLMEQTGVDYLFIK